MSVFKEIVSDFKAMDQNNAAMRKFGFVCGIVLIVIGGVMLFRRGLPETALLSAPAILLLLGLLVLLMTLIYPVALKPVNSVLVIASLFIGYFVTRLILVVLFYGMFLPMGLILRLFGKDSLRLKQDASIATYWTIRPDEPFDPARCRRLF
jgi:hypothetical protein